MKTAQQEYECLRRQLQRMANCHPDDKSPASCYASKIDVRYLGNYLDIALALVESLLEEKSVSPDELLNERLSLRADKEELLGALTMQSKHVLRVVENMSAKSADANEEKS